VFPVIELVNYGLDGKQPSLKNGGIHLSAEEYHRKMEEENTVIIDIRNSYEAAIGHFKPPPGGAEYIDPKMRVSTEFPAWVDNNKARLEGKQIMMFCTGGIRCERASALLKDKGMTNPVFQMQGGIHNYLEKYNEGGGYFKGHNYTFDKRFLHGAKDAEIIGNCNGCQTPFNKYRHKKRCLSCGVPLLICESCQTKKLELVVVCQLCNEQNMKVTKKFKKDKGGVKRIDCGVCGVVFESRNKMFKHLNETGHADRKSRKK
jgi:predicted sulfurtransferase